VTKSFCAPPTPRNQLRRMILKQLPRLFALGAHFRSVSIIDGNPAGIAVQLRRAF
jgi:hypothetical protein